MMLLMVWMYWLFFMRSQMQYVIVNKGKISSYYIYSHTHNKIKIYVFLVLRTREHISSTNSEYLMVLKDNSTDEIKLLNQKEKY